MCDSRASPHCVPSPGRSRGDGSEAAGPDDEGRSTALGGAEAADSETASIGSAEAGDIAPPGATEGGAVALALRTGRAVPPQPTPVPTTPTPNRACVVRMAIRPVLKRTAQTSP